MAGKPSKKGRNPGVVDKWLDDLQLYRKNVAYDETCLFRAVSEQVNSNTNNSASCIIKLFLSYLSVRYFMNEFVKIA